jgi:hypothetical protein
MYDFRKIVKSLILLSVLVSSVSVPLSLPSTVYSDDAKKVTLTVGDKVRFSNNLEATYQGYNAVKKKPIWKSTIQAPTYTDENIKIDTTWKYVSENKFESKENLFTAIIDNEKVTVNDGELSWTPIIELTYSNGERVSAKYQSSLLIHDYINPNYMANIIRMTYVVKGYTLYRDLRIIEGVLCEYYYLPNNPNADVTIYQNAKGDTSHMAKPIAWDANNKPIKVDNSNGNKKVLAMDLSNVAYPVIIDPTNNYYTSANDGFTDHEGGTWAHNWAETTSTNVYDALTVLYVGQAGSGTYPVFRGSVFFDTSDLPDDAVMSSGKVGLYGYLDDSDTDFYITVQSGMPTYPHDPLVTGDYDKSLYSGMGGNITTVGFNASGYNNITLSSDGFGWISKTGTTKFQIRSSKDIAGTLPTTDEWVGFYSYEKGAGYRPFLEVTYTATPPSVTTIAATSVACNVSTLNGEITNTGGDTNTLRGFIYGTTSNSTTPGSTQVPPAGYTSNWTEVGSFSTGTFNKALTGLTQGQTYYFRAFGKNSGGYSYGADELTWTCFDDPTIIVQAATTITTSTARLQSHLNDMGGVACAVRFGWGTVNQGDNIAAYQHTSAYAGSHETGATPYLDVDTLTAGATYYFNVEASNGCGLGHGTVTSFVTEATVGSPSNVIAIPSTTSIVLSWVKGTGATDTMIRYSINSCPTSNTTGTLLYNSTASTYTHTGLTSGTDYCYWVSGYDVISGFSTTAVTVHSTTIAGSATSNLFNTPVMPTDTFRTPSATSFEAKNPIAPYLTNIASVMGFPIGNLWLVMTMLLISFLSFMAFKITNGLEAPLVVLILGFGFGGIMGIIPGLLAAFLIPIAVGILIMKLRSNV